MGDRKVTIIASRTAKYPKSVVQAQLKELVGQEVWFRTSREDVNHGVIERVMGMGHATIRVSESQTVTVHADNIYITKEDLLGANYKIFKSRIDAYCREIKDVNDLVQFCYDHHVSECGEYADAYARIAVRQRAMELLGIEVDPKAAETIKEINEILETEPEE